MATAVPPLGPTVGLLGARRALAGLLAAMLVATVLVAYQGRSSAATPSAGVSAATLTAAGGSGGNGVEPGTCPAHNTTSFAKTKFLLHSGLAFGAFHRYIYKPFRAGTFSSGGGHVKRLLAFGKAGAAGLFIVHEVRLAAQDAQANPTLCRAIAAPLRSFYNHVRNIGTLLRHGDTSAVTSAEKSLSSATSISGSHGLAIHEDQNAKI